MSLTVVAQPQNESELSVMLCLLHAQDIPVFVQGQGFGSLYPGPQIAFYNARRVMVPTSLEADALEALSVFHAPEGPRMTHRAPRLWGIVRMVLEWLLFAWCVPPHSRHRVAADIKPDH